MTCGGVPRLYDVVGALWELRDEGDYAEFRDALVDGYRAHRNLDVSHLDDFIAVRQVALTCGSPAWPGQPCVR